ncbi:hypothetical protein LPU83_pLPU83b_0082 (plasmid) [Rhizobium favelukesii]|uniref:Uncharacterized protein n=1 Tax=Rhizobium favelukesii TaxID=348824 RepID=W6S0S7_9HYPH|nr:hypothetical protein LPU83_pLPU83b_0082 [Rhizobium favelukesii]
MIKECKRHIVGDTLGLAVGLMVHSADIQDRDGVIRNATPIDRRCAGPLEIYPRQKALVAAGLCRWLLTLDVA